MPDVRHVLRYDYVEDIVERRTPYREGHLALAREWKDDGRLLAGGALGDPPHGGMFVFAVDEPEVLHRYVDADPYVAAGLVTGWRIERWNVVV
jgi:uncharacterized protein YciI